jgi:hypothetical protein
VLEISGDPAVVDLEEGPPEGETPPESLLIDVSYSPGVGCIVADVAEAEMVPEAFVDGWELLLEEGPEIDSSWLLCARLVASPLLDVEVACAGKPDEATPLCPAIEVEDDVGVVWEEAAVASDAEGLDDMTVPEDDAEVKGCVEAEKATMFGVDGRSTTAFSSGLSFTL